MYQVIAQPRCMLVTGRVSSYRLSELAGKIERGEETCPLMRLLAEFCTETLGKGAGERALEIF
jgi:hypothetical protein